MEGDISHFDLDLLEEKFFFIYMFLTEKYVRLLLFALYSEKIPLKKNRSKWSKVLQGKFNIVSLAVFI